MRNIKSVEDAKNNLKGIKNTEAIISYPPAYLQGFRLRANGTQLIVGKGCMNCRGHGVNHKVDDVISGEDFVSPDYIVKGITYYVYMNKNKVFKVDSRPPVYDDEYFTYFHPVLYEYRYLGKSLLRANGIWTEIRNQNPITGADITAAAVTAEEIAAGTIVAANIAAGTITAAELSADAIETKILEVGHIYVGFTSYSGTTTFTVPGEGDRVHYIDGTLDYYYEFTGGSWVTTNGILIGGFIGTLFLSMIGCTGLYHPQNPPTATEFLPSSDFRVFNFENDYKDQHGLDDWDSKDELVFSSTERKFGSYSLFATNGNHGALSLPGGGQIGSSQADGTWVKITASGTSSATFTLKFMIKTVLPALSDDIFLGIKYVEGSSTAGLVVGVLKDDVAVLDDVFVCDVPVGWSYVGYSYDSDTDKLYVIVNNNIYDQGVLGETWSVGEWDIFQVRPANAYFSNNTTISIYIDELLFYWDKYLDPNLLVQHYNHNIPWVTTYSKADILLRPGVDGSVVIPAGYTLKPLGDVDFTDATIASLFKHIDSAACATGVQNTAHGLGVAPSVVLAEIICTSAELGYSVGDPVLMSSSAGNASTYGWSITYDVTNITALLLGGIIILTKNTAVHGLITLAKWKWRFKYIA